MSIGLSFSKLIISLEIFNFEIKSNPSITYKLLLYYSSKLNKKFFFLNLNYLSTENSTLNYAPINLLSTKRLNHNLINSFVKKNSVSPQDIWKKIKIKLCKSKSTKK